MVVRNALDAGQSTHEARGARWAQLWLLVFGSKGPKSRRPRILHGLFASFRQVVQLRATHASIILVWPRGWRWRSTKPAENEATSCAKTGARDSTFGLERATAFW